MEAAGLWLIPVIIVVIIAGTFIVVRGWIHASQRDMSRIGSKLRSFAIDLAQLSTAAQDFTAEAAGPYGSPASRLNADLEQINSQLQLHTSLYSDVRQRMRRAASGQAEAIIRGPFVWLEVRRQVRLLDRQSERLQEQVSQAWKSVERLQRMGWQVAESARQAHERLEKASTTAHELRAAGVTGQAFNNAIRTGGRLRNTIQNLPAYFFDPNPEEVLAQADKETIIEVDQTLSEQRPELDGLLARMEAWKRQYSESNQMLESIRKSVDELRGALMNTPAGLLVDKTEIQLHELNRLAGNLRNRLAAPQAEELRNILQEAQAGAKKAEAETSNFATARQQIIELHAVIRDLRSGLAAIERQMIEHERNQHYPLHWDASRQAAVALEEEARALGGVEKGRTPEQVSTDLPAARTLLEKVRELDKTTKAASGRYGQLLQVLQTIDPQQHSESFNTARQLVGPVAAYAPENWPRQDAAGSYAVETTQFLHLVQQVTPGDPGAPVHESRLKEQLEQAESASRQSEKLQVRTGRIAERLKALQELERSAEEKLNQVVSLFNQVDRLAQINPIVEQAAARTETERLWQEGQRYADDLFQESKRKQGLVEKKVQKVDNWYRRVEVAANGWLTRLQADLKVRREELSTKLERLNEIALLEDPVLISARNWQEEQNVVVDVPAPKSGPLPLTQLMVELKRQNDSWQRLVGLMQAIEDEVESGVMEAYNGALAQRQRTWTQLENAARALPEGLSWPPTLENLIEEHSDFDRVEHQWERLRQNGQRANRLILQLGEITRGYQAVEEGVARTMERADSERERIAYLEGGIVESMQMWQSLAGQNAHNPTTQQAINRLLGDSHNALENIKRQYLTGSRSYQQVEQDLHNLSKRINSAHAPVEGGGQIDINGDMRTGNRY